MYFPTPPWERVEVTATRGVLRVPAPQGTLVMGGLPGARMGVVVEERSGTTARQWVEAQVASSVGRGAVLTRPPAERAVTGGRVLSATLDEGSGGHLLAAADLPGGGTLTLEFRALRAVTDDPDLTALVASVELRRSAP